MDWMLCTQFLLIPAMFLYTLYALFIPKSLTMLLKLKHSRKSSDFRETVLWIFLTLYFFSILYATAFRAILLFNPYVPKSPFSFAMGLFVIIFLYYFIIPTTYSCFQKWQISRDSSHFSKMLLLSFLAFLILSIFTINTIQHVF